MSVDRQNSFPSLPSNHPVPPNIALYVRALYDYAAPTPSSSSLSFQAGDVIRVLNRLESGWWDGILGNVRGWFPSNYTEIIAEEPVNEETETENAADDDDDEEVEETETTASKKEDRLSATSDDQEEDEQEEFAVQQLLLSKSEDGDTSSRPDQTQYIDAATEQASWVPRLTQHGQLFYYNPLTGKSTAHLNLPDGRKHTHSQGHAQASHPTLTSLSQRLQAQQHSTSSQHYHSERLGGHATSNRVPPETLIAGIDQSEIEEDEGASSEAPAATLPVTGLEDETKLFMDTGTTNPGHRHEGNDVGSDISSSGEADRNAQLHEALSRKRSQLLLDKTQQRHAQSSFGTNQPCSNPVPTTLTFLPDSHLPEAPTWELLRSHTNASICTYRTAILTHRLHAYVPLVEDISDHLRFVLAAASGSSDNHSGSANIMDGDRDLAPFFRVMMTRFSKLVLNSYLAAGAAEWEESTGAYRRKVGNALHDDKFDVHDGLRDEFGEESDRSLLHPEIKCLNSSREYEEAVNQFIDKAKELRGEEIVKLNPGFVAGIADGSPAKGICVGGNWLGNNVFTEQGHIKKTTKARGKQVQEEKVKTAFLEMSDEHDDDDDEEDIGEDGKGLGKARSRGDNGDSEAGGFLTSATWSTDSSTDGDTDTSADLDEFDDGDDSLFVKNGFYKGFQRYRRGSYYGSSDEGELGDEDGFTDGGFDEKENGLMSRDMHKDRKGSSKADISATTDTGASPGTAHNEGLNGDINVDMESEVSAALATAAADTAVRNRIGRSRARSRGAPANNGSMSATGNRDTIIAGSQGEQRSLLTATDQQDPSSNYIPGFETKRPRPSLGLSRASLEKLQPLRAALEATLRGLDNSTLWTSGANTSGHVHKSDSDRETATRSSEVQGLSEGPKENAESVSFSSALDSTVEREKWPTRRATSTLQAFGPGPGVDFSAEGELGPSSTSLASGQPHALATLTVQERDQLAEKVCAAAAEVLKCYAPLATLLEQLDLAKFVDREFIKDARGQLNGTGAYETDAFGNPVFGPGLNHAQTQADQRRQPESVISGSMSNEGSPANSLPKSVEARSPYPYPQSIRYPSTTQLSSSSAATPASSISTFGTSASSITVPLPTPAAFPKPRYSSQSQALLDVFTYKQRLYDAIGSLVLACQAIGAPLADEWSGFDSRHGGQSGPYPEAMDARIGTLRGVVGMGMGVLEQLGVALNELIEFRVAKKKKQQERRRLTGHGLGGRRHYAGTLQSSNGTDGQQQSRNARRTRIMSMKVKPSMDKAHRFFGEPTPTTPTFAANGGKAQGTAADSRHGSLLPKSGAGAGPGSMHGAIGGMGMASSPTGSSVTPWFLRLDHETEVVYEEKQGQVLIKSGTLTGLVEQLTRHDKLDTSFHTNFLMTYSLFTTASELFEHLVHRFTLQPPLGSLDESQLQIWTRQKQIPIRIRVVNTLKTWLETHWMEANDNGEDGPTTRLLKRIQTFVNEAMASTKTPGASQLLALIDQRLQMRGPEQAVTSRKLIPAVFNAPPPIVPKGISSNPKVLKKLKLLDLDPVEMARQLCIYELKLFAKIKPVECLHRGWMKTPTSDGEAIKFAPNIRGMIRHSNQLTNWATETILQENDVKRRATIIKFWINVALQCEKMENYSSMHSIMLSLNGSAIQRLQRTWSQISTRMTESVEHMQFIMGGNMNFSLFRTLVRNANPPCIPFLGIYLTDLVYATEVVPSHTSTNTINFAKYRLTSQIVQQIQQLQAGAYQFQPVPILQEWIEDRIKNATQWTIDTAGERSCALEPKERDDEKIQRILTESGFL